MRDSPRISRRAFTLVEMMLAAVVAATLALGVYGLMYQTLRVEGRWALRWRASRPAEIAVRHLAQALESAQRAGAIKPVIARGEPKSLEIECVTFDSGGGEPKPGWSPLQLRRYVWKVQADNKGELTVQTIGLAGSMPLLAERTLPKQSINWDYIKSRKVVPHLDNLSVEFAPADSPAGPWSNDWNGETMVVRISAVADGRRFTRLIAPPALQRPIDRADGGE